VPAVLERLSRAEDGTLRRLHCLEQLGAELSPQMKQLKDEIRKRDRRIDIRDPDDRAVISPIWIT
jgi:hypothetical protein